MPRRLGAYDAPMKKLTLVAAAMISACVGRPPDIDDGVIADGGPVKQPFSCRIFYTCPGDPAETWKEVDRCAVDVDDAERQVVLSDEMARCENADALCLFGEKTLTGAPCGVTCLQGAGDCD